MANHFHILVKVPERAKFLKRFEGEGGEAKLRSGGKLSRADLLFCRVRWFGDGVAIGSKGFVEGVFNGCRGHFGAKRKDGARRVREDAAGSLHALRELRLKPVG
jgi:putative transposase